MGLITYLRHRSAAPGPGVGDLPEGIDVRAQSWDGGPDGVLVLHGFTGSPHSMRPWAREWARRGYAVELPLLPGHGTSVADMATRNWREWAAAVDDAYWRLAARCERVGVAGLSMGGALALHLAARRLVAALSLVNPGLVSPQPLSALGGPLSRVVPTVPGVRDDIRREGVSEGAYPRVPVAAAGQMHRLFAAARRSLGAVRAPVQVLRSEVDHVVTDASLRALRSGLPQAPEVVPLPDSWHVATLDHDAPLIFAASARFFADHGLRAASDPTARESRPGPPADVRRDAR
ncbi:alpha/beta fold hydrolase [Rothia kristinae]|uniref:Alpha/beta fold hydrolase n=1 Tax=Rothia kristinae TaxID=37923 RepID=A0A7T4MUP9_9MICC|nr:alpha/beta fold hydrolase [Rothia kristinae]QQC59814.1 alpha/beta fold hydrolase [Rothia kristinae]